MLQISRALTWNKTKSPKYPSSIPPKFLADILKYKNRSRLGDISEDIKVVKNYLHWVFTLIKIQKNNNK